MKFLIVVIGAVLIGNVIHGAPSARKPDAVKVIEYLESYGYLPPSKNKQRHISAIQLEHGLRRLQKFAHIDVTGKINARTMEVVEAPRCGLPDIFRKGNRVKRFSLLSAKWDRHLIMWHFDSKHLEPYHSNSTRIRERISEALAKWSSVSVLKFQETLNVDKADVVVSFEKPAHPKVDPYEMADSVLAHAFRPGGGVGGDVHLRDDIDWDFRVSNEDRPEPGTTSFFAVVLHELGHSLGLDHSSHTDAVMFPSYSTSTGTMSKDDIEGIHHIYGVPVQPTTKRPVPPDDTMIFPDDDRIVPEPCDTSYDAIVYIHHEKFIFKGRFMWRPDSSKRMVKIRDTWPDLPERLTHVDAVYENDKGNLMFFIDRDIYEFRGIDLVEKSTLTALGIDDSVQKVDAVFKWNYNKQSYIFARQDYWRLDGERVDKKYPRKILPVWREVHNIDTAMSYGDDLYFFKGKYFYKFDPVPMRLDVMHQNTSAQVFMGCPAEEKPMVFENRFGEEVDLKDFADALDHGEPVVFKTDSDNPEKDEKLFTTRKPNSSSSHHLHIFFFLASLAVSRAFSSPAASF